MSETTTDSVFLADVGGLPTPVTKEYLVHSLGQDQSDKLIFNISKSGALEGVDTQHAQFLRDLTGGATIEERDTWQAKELAARALLAQSAANAEAEASNETPPEIATAAQTDMLTIEATYLGTDAASLAVVIVGKADLFKKLTGLAAGVRGKARAAIKASTTTEQLEAAITQAQTDVQAALAAFTGG